MDYDFGKQLDIDVDVNLDFNTTIDFDKDVDVEVNIDSDLDLDGNYAQLTLDVEAIGGQTLVEVDASVLTVEGELSSVVLSVISATNSFDV